MKHFHFSTPVLTLMLATLVACGGSFEELTERADPLAHQISQQQSIWNAARLSNYRYTYLAVPQCDTADSVPTATITVQNKRATGAYFLKLEQVDGNTPGATKLEISGPSGTTISYVLERRVELDSRRLTIDDIFSQLSDLNQKKKLAKLKFDERYGTPTYFEILSDEKCSAATVTVSVPTPI